MQRRAQTGPPPPSRALAHTPIRDVMRVTPDGYELGKRLRSGVHSELREATRIADGQQVVLKLYTDDDSGDSLPRVRRELDALQRITSTGVPRVFDLDRTTERPVLVLERLPGESLASRLEAGPLDTALGLAVATSLAETLTQIHAARILHKDLTPYNILLEKSSERVWICDFGLASVLGAVEQLGRSAGGRSEALLLYMAPEQTGRMNRGCDFRSDLYSLGVTLYHMFVGHPPFESADALELIHAHIARVPRSPATLRPELPSALSRVLLKLLRKEPEERYQSASALHADLLTCRERWQRDGAIEDFELGLAEVPAHPRFVRKLYGREQERARLDALYAQAARGLTHSLWIRGESGSGKSALMDDLRPAVARTGGHLALGRFDPYRGRPYAGWISALGSLVQQLLVEREECLQRWQEALREGLGGIAHALVDLVPDLAFILGDVPSVPSLGPAETQARLALAVQRFVLASATPEHPLVLFLDDLQWIDVESRTLLEELLDSKTECALLLVGAYRPADVGAEHSLASLIGRTGRVTDSTEVLELGALSSDSVVAMLADALERTPEATRELAEMVERRTANSPLLAQELIAHLHGLGLLRYVRGQGWLWDLREIAAANIPDGAVALMTGKLGRLPTELRAVLELASCVDDEFDTGLLGRLTGRSESELEQALHALADAGLIAPSLRGFRFVHARLREAVQQLLSSNDRARVHADIARLLLERTPEAERAPCANEIAEHLNRSVTHLPEELRLTAVEVNAQAGGRFLAAGAAAAAAPLFASARALVREEDWLTHPALLLDVALQGTESAFQCGDFRQAQALLDELEGRSLASSDRVRLGAKRIQVLAVTADPETSVRCALRNLQRVGVYWPLHPSRLRALLTLRFVLWRLSRRAKRGPSPSTKGARPERAGALTLLASCSAVLARVDVNLAVLATCFNLRAEISGGSGTRPNFALAVDAAYLHILLGNHGRAEAIMRSDLALSGRGHEVFAPRTRLIAHAILYPFMMRRRQALADMEGIAEASREVGDAEFAHYARFMHSIYLALAGDRVADTARRFARIADSARSSSQWYLESARCCRVYALLGEDRSDLPLVIAQVDATIGDLSRATYACTLWIQVLCVQGRFDLAFAQSERTIGFLFRGSPFVHVVDHMFYRGLAAAALAGSARGWKRRRYHRELSRSLRHVARHVAGGPDFSHMATFLRAEDARLRHDFTRARNAYEQAALRARQQTFPHHCALARERLAQMLLALRRETEAGEALREAIAAYREWGADAKAQALDASRVALGDLLLSDSHG